MLVGAADARAILYLPCGIQKLRRGDVSLLSTMVSFAPTPRLGSLLRVESSEDVVIVVNVDDGVDAGGVASEANNTEDRGIFNAKRTELLVLLLVILSDEPINVPTITPTQTPTVKPAETPVQSDVEISKTREERINELITDTIGGHVNERYDTDEYTLLKIDVRPPSGRSFQSCRARAADSVRWRWLP